MNDYSPAEIPHTGDPHELVRVYTVQEPTLAELIRQELSAEGIRCEISGENQAGLTGLLKIEMFVPAVDAERARALLAQFEQRQSANV